MDFVVVGFGLGALGVLLGVVMVGWLAPRAQRAAGRAPAGESAYGLAIAAERRGTGQAFLYAGAAMLLVTVGGLAGSLDDRTGALLVTTTATVAAVGILLRGFLHRARHPTPPRRRTRPAAAADAAAAVAPPVMAPRAVAADAVAPTGTAETGTMTEDSFDFEEASRGHRPTMDAASEEMSPLLATAGDEPASVAGDAGPGDEPPIVAASTDPDSRRRTETPDRRERDETALAEDEEAVIVGYVVPATRAEPAPSRPDEGEDPS